MPKARLSHVGLGAKNPRELAMFYHDLFGMDVVGGAANGSNAFVGSHVEEENHDLAFFRTPTAAHIGLRVESPAELLSLYEEIKKRGLPINFTWNHGFALALYFTDPEGNAVEVYWPTGRCDYQPPYVEPLTLEGQTEESLRNLVAAMLGQQQRSST